MWTTLKKLIMSKISGFDGSRRWKCMNAVFCCRCYSKRIILEHFNSIIAVLSQYSLIMQLLFFAFLLDQKDFLLPGPPDRQDLESCPPGVDLRLKRKEEGKRNFHNNNNHTNAFYTEDNINVSQENNNHEVHLNNVVKENFDEWIMEWIVEQRLIFARKNYFFKTILNYHVQKF